MQALKDASAAELADSALENVPRKAMSRLRGYVGLLLRWNAAINLVGRGDADVVWTRHVADCLRLVPLMPPTAALRERGAIDLGSGAGLPGLVLAVATGVPFVLVEADRRKAAFLLEAARVTAAPVTVHCARIEAVSLAPAFLAPAPLVTARALAPLTRLLDYAHPLLAPGGVCLFPKGAGAAAEIAEARRQGWRFTVERHDAAAVLGAMPGSTVLRISDLARA